MTFKKFSEKQTGFLLIILSGVCFGSLGFFGKKAFARNIAPGELLALRYSISALLMGAIILVTKPKSFLLSRFQVISSLLLGIFGYALFSSLFFFALTGLSASLTVLLLYTYPIMIAILSRFLLKENLGKKGIFALAVASIGILGLVWGEFKISDPKFLWLGIGAAFFYSIYIMLSRKYLSDVEAMPSSFYVQLGAGIVLTLINFEAPQRAYEILANNTVLIVSMSFICSLLAMTLFLAGLRRITSSEASILSTTEPLFGILLAALFLGEKLTSIQLVGGVLIIAAMILLATNNARAD